MKLPTKCRYGLRAVLEIARTYGSGPAKRKDIAASQELSDSYLENILIVLKNNHVIDTTRGVNGGYVLSRHPKEITMLDIVCALDGPPEIVECVSKASSCKRSSTCVSRTVWQELSAAWHKILVSTTLQDLLDREITNEAPSYSI